MEIVDREPWPAELKIDLGEQLGAMTYLLPEPGLLRAPASVASVGGKIDRFGQLILTLTRVDGSVVGVTWRYSSGLPIVVGGLTEVSLEEERYAQLLFMHVNLIVLTAGARALSSAGVTGDAIAQLLAEGGWR